MAIIRASQLKAATPATPVREVSFKGLFDNVVAEDESGAEAPAVDLLQIIDNRLAFKQSGRGRSPKNKGKTVLDLRALPEEILIDEVDAFIEGLLGVRAQLKAEGIVTEFRKGNPLDELLAKGSMSRTAAPVAAPVVAAPTVKPVVATVRNNSEPVLNTLRMTRNEEDATDEGAAADLLGELDL
jgi:hypothetical protein